MGECERGVGGVSGSLGDSGDFLDERFGFADREVAGDDIACRVALSGIARQRQKRACMTHRQSPRGDFVPHFLQFALLFLHIQPRDCDLV